MRWRKVDGKGKGNLLHGAAEPGSGNTGHHLLPEESAHLLIKSLAKLKEAHLSMNIQIDN